MRALLLAPVLVPAFALVLAPVLAAPAGAVEPPLVALDVGHFTLAPGATSARGRSELEFNRDLAALVREALARRGLRVRLIGYDGEMSVLSRRAAAARGADLLLSIHHDSVQPHFLQDWTYEGENLRFSDRYAGFSLFVSRRNPALPASLACASAVGAAMNGAGFVPSLYHADPIPGESKSFADRANGVHYYDNLVVLHAAAQAAVLVEAGVIVNRDEELALRDPARQSRMAEAIADGVRSCLGARGRTLTRRGSLG